MSEKKNLSIEFSEEVTQKYLEITGKKTEAEVNADCMPSGVTISIDVGGPFGSVAFVDGKEIGEVELSLS